MKEKMRVPYALSVHGPREVKAATRVLEGNTALADHTIVFEKRIAQMFGKKFGVMVNSGSSANLLAIELLKLPPGSEVITPLLTFSTVIAPLVQKSLIPVFVDVEPGTYLANIDQIERCITKRTRALVVPSLIGNVPDLLRIQKIAKNHKLWFIEDSCDTLGGTHRKKPTGWYSDISTTSFYGSHIINGAGGGGMILVNSIQWKERLLMLRGWGRKSSLMGESKSSENPKKRFASSLKGVSYDSKFIFDEIGYNFLPLEISSAFALEQLRRYPGFAEIRRKNFNRLKKFFQKYEKYFILPVERSDVSTPWLGYPLTIKKSAPFTRKDICMYLENNQIQTRPIFTGNILRQPGFRNIIRKTPFNSYPYTNHVMSHGFLIGCHQGLTHAHLTYLEKVFMEFLGTYGAHR